MTDKFSLNFDIGAHMSDYEYNLRPTAFLEMAQHLAVRAAQALSFGDEELSPHSCAWVLARMHVEFLKPVHFNQIVRMDTWHRGYNGLFFVRDYQLIGADGTPAINSTSSWIVMNTVTRKAEWGDFLKDIIPSEPQCPEAAVENLAQKIITPRNQQMTLLGSHHVRYSDVDHNQHVNNVKYTLWSMDYLPEDLVYNHKVKSLSINFNNEARRGDTVDLWHIEADGAHIVEGRRGDRQIFILKLVFE